MTGPLLQGVKPRPWSCTMCWQDCDLELNAGKFMSKCCTATVRPTKEMPHG